MNFTMSGADLATFDGTPEELRQVLSILERDHVERELHSRSVQRLYRELAWYRAREQRKKAIDEQATT